MSSLIPWMFVVLLLVLGAVLVVGYIANRTANDSEAAKVAAAAVKDSQDLTSCRAAFSADLNDARWDAVRLMLFADHQLTPNEVVALWAPADKANVLYRTAIDQSREHPAKFLANCRR